MSTEANTSSASEEFLPPTDFAEYEKWVNDGRNETDESAESDDKSESKTESESETEEDRKKDESSESPQKKSGFQRRVDKLNRRIGERDARIAELERRLSSESKPAPPQAQAQQPQPAVAKTEGRPEAKNFGTYEEYVEALADWKLDQREKTKALEAQQREAAKAQREAIDAHSSRVREAMEDRYPDWKEKVAEANDIPISPATHAFIVESEHGPDVAYYLAENPDHAARILKLPPLRQAAELGKIEARFAEESETKSEKKKPASDKPQPRVSKAPPPPKTVRGGKAESSEPDPSDFAAWEKWRNAQPGARIRR